jgi:hypothetical protein
VTIAKSGPGEIAANIINSVITKNSGMKAPLINNLIEIIVTAVINYTRILARKTIE